MVKGIVQEISHVRHVQISKPSQSSTEVSWVMMCSEYAPKACIEEGLGVISKRTRIANVIIKYLESYRFQIFYCVEQIFIQEQAIVSVKLYMY